MSKEVQRRIVVENNDGETAVHINGSFSAIDAAGMVYALIEGFAESRAFSKEQILTLLMIGVLGGEEGTGNE